MTRQRRNHLLILALVPAVVFGTIRCADSPAAPSAAAVRPDVALKLARLHARYDSTGVIHNALLAHVLPDLQRIPESGRTRAVVCETARRSAADFYRTRLGRGVPASTESEFMNSCLGKGTSPAILGILMMPGSQPRLEISEAAASYMDQAASAVDASSSPADLQSRISVIEANAAANLSEDEAAAVVTVGSVATSSAEYWSSNLSAWVYVGNTPDYSRLAPLASRSIEAPRLGGTAAADKTIPDLWDELWPNLVSVGKTAVKADAKAAAKSIIGLSISGAAIAWEVVGTAAGVGSMAAILHL